MVQLKLMQSKIEYLHKGIQQFLLKLNFIITLETAVCGAFGLYCIVILAVSIILSTPFISMRVV